MNINFQRELFNKDYLLELCKRRIMYLTFALVFGGMISSAYEYYSNEYVVQISYFHNLAQFNDQNSNSVTLNPGITLARWQLIVKSLPSYLVSIEGINASDPPVLKSLSSSIWYDNSLRPILTYTKSDIREYSQLTAQGVLEKNNVIGFTVTSRGSSIDLAVKFNSELKKEFIKMSESFIIKEVLLQKAPWLWNEKTLTTLIEKTQGELRVLNEDIEYLSKISRERPELISPYVITGIHNPDSNFAYLPLALQLNSRLYQNKMTAHHLNELITIKSRIADLDRIFFDLNTYNKQGILSYEKLLRANSFLSNTIFIDIIKTIHAEIQFFKEITPLPSSMIIKSSFNFIDIIFSSFFALIITFVCLVLIDKKHFILKGIQGISLSK